MKKIIKILIILISIQIIFFAGWYFLIRDKNMPLADSVRTLLPFGSGEGLTLPPSEEGGVAGGENPLTSTTDELGQGVNLFRLSVEPVAGAIAFTKASSTGSTGSPQATVVRYVDRATGHIFEVVLPVLATSETLQKTKIVNKTLPKVYEAYFRPDGNAVLMRSMRGETEVVENLSLALIPPSLKATTTDGLYSVTAAVLRGDIGSVVSDAGNTLYYSLRDSGSIVSSPFNGTSLKTLFTSAFTDWRLAGAGSSLILYTKASAKAAGYAYSLNPSSGALVKILGPLNGLTVTPDSLGTRLIYSYMEDSSAKSQVKNLQSGAVTSILPVTLAEKCVWSTRNKGVVYCGSPTNGVGAGEPDNWYQGRTHFSDRLWRFDTNGEIAQILSEPKTSLGVDLDVIGPKLSPKEDYLIFTNKTDLSLWALKLEQF